jgi:RNA polymerase sigma-70 factor (ECF subfamily)
VTASEAAKQKFRQMAAPHLDDAYSLAKYLAGNGADAEDIVQEACIRALAGLESSTVLQPRAWFLTIVRNSAFTFLARHRSKVLVGEDVGDLEQKGALNAAAPQPDAEAALIARDEGAEAQRAIAALPLALRETLILRLLNGLSYREIALATESPVGTVMSRLARARAAVAAALGGKS